MKEKVRTKKRQHSGRRHHNRSRQKTEEALQYKVLFYKGFAEALADKECILATTLSCDQLNVVIEAEGNMDNPEILDIDPKVKLFAGKAWHHIHQERYEAGWYSEPRGLENSFN